MRGAASLAMQCYQRHTTLLHQTARRSYRDQVVKDEVEADSPQQVTGYGVELAFLSHHGLQQGGLPSVTSRGSLAGKG